MELFVNLIQNKALNIDALITHEYNLADVEEVYQTLQSGKSLGLVLSYNPDQKKHFYGMHEVFDQCNFILDKHKVIPFKAPPGVIKFSAIGAGGFAKVKLLPIIAKISLAKIHSVVDVDVTNSMNVARQYGAIRVSNNYQEFLGDDDINAVVIATPHHLHAQQALNFMKSGKAVFVEKPAAVNYEQLTQLKHFLGKHGKEVLYCVDFNRSFSPFMLSIKEVLKKRINPAIIHYRMNAGYLPKNHWIQSPINNGRIIGEGCHIFELFCFLTDAKPIAVSVEALNTHNNDLLSTDNFTATISMSDGSCCSFIYTAIGNSSMGKERMEIFFDGKSLVMDDFLELTGYGMPMSFNQKVNVQDRGHQRLLYEFFAATKTKDFQPPIPYERIILATELSFVVNRLAVAGGGTQAI